MAIDPGRFPVVEKLTEELQLVVREGAWASAIASIHPRLEQLTELVDPEETMSPTEQVLAIEDLLKMTVRKLQDEAEIGNVVAQLLGLTPPTYGQKLKVRRKRAAEEMGVAVSTFRKEYQSTMISIVVWALVECSEWVLLTG